MEKYGNTINENMENMEILYVQYNFLKKDTTSSNL